MTAVHNSDSLFFIIVAGTCLTVSFAIFLRYNVIISDSSGAKEERKEFLIAFMELVVLELPSAINMLDS